MNMLNGEFNKINQKRLFFATVSALAISSAMILSYKQHSEEKIITIGEVTCQGAESFQFEAGTTIAEIANNIETHSELSDAQNRDLRSIVNKSIINQVGESALRETATPTNGIFGTELNQTISIYLPSQCQAHDLPF
jgi:hypothetical protein